MTSSATTGSVASGSAQASSASGGGCNAGPNEDLDKDGFSLLQGDCDDCNAGANPNAFEIPGGGVDDDCNGKVDEAPTSCDGTLTIDSKDPLDAAKAVGLCKISSGTLQSGATPWGLISAAWVNLDQSPPPASANYALGHGMLSGFGANGHPQEGKRMLVLSSGTARQPSDAGYQSVSGFDKEFSDPYPKGQFPKEEPKCSGVSSGSPTDGVAVRLKIRTPSNARGLAYDFAFFSYEWPDFVCSTFNDFFAAMLDPAPKGQADGNIALDPAGKPVTVNSVGFRACGCDNGPPCSAGGQSYACSLGASLLKGTGFGKGDGDAAGSDHGATGWLAAHAPVEPNSDITVQLAVADAGDGIEDSTALIDNWRWIAESGVKVGSEPVANPK